MKIYTKTGDKGLTSLFGGERVGKNHARLEAYGTVDELNSILGICHAEADNEELQTIIKKLQNQLFVVGGDLASPKGKLDKNKHVVRVTEEEIKFLEQTIDELTGKLPEIKYFILPGGSKAAAYLHLARTVCRRTERLVVSLSNTVDIGNDLVVYLNRLSDLLFTLARYANVVSNIPDVRWDK